MYYVNKRVLLLIFMVCSSTYLWSKNAAVDQVVAKNIYDYRISNGNHQEFLKNLAYTKDSPQFLRDNAKFIQNAPQELLEAAYWTAYKLNKKSLVQELLMIIESRGQ